MASRQLDEEAIFHIARKIDDTETRVAYLDQICADDQDLRNRVEELLGVHEQESEFLKSSAGPGPTKDHSPTSERPGQQIGRYKLLDRLGEGGMGTVFMAEQLRPVKRRVAVKVIKQGMDTRQFIARFEAERQALALMDHPNIARVLDAGCTDTGRPYFVMELVKGVPITQFCDENRLTARQRIELFISVCHAVQHAHQKGIIHRDLKPSNVLVALYDDKPVPKVIDFGVAKATNQQLTERTLFTQVGQIVGTWEYMSPEQAVLNQLDVDTRTDIYSLGVILYELLTGVTPLEPARLRKAAIEETLRLIREEEPPRPSNRISSLGETATATAAYRGTDARSLARIIRGDMDWIVMKALEKDRSRRYETANAMAADLNRYLQGEAIEARPPSTAYRLRKAASRHRVALVATSVVALSLLAGTVTTSWFALREYRARLETDVLAEKYREEVFQTALTATLMRDPNAPELLKQAKAVGVEEADLAFLRGHLNVHSGEMTEATIEFERARNLRDTIPVHASLAVVYHCLGDTNRELSEIQWLNKQAPSGAEDYLFLAQSLTFTHPTQAVKHARTAIRKRDSLFGHVVLAGALSQYAIDTDSEDTIEEAVCQADAVAVLMKDNAYVLGVQLFANLAAMRLAEKHHKDSHLYRSTAVVAATGLESFPTYAMGRLLRAHYFDYVENDAKKAAEEFRAAAGGGIGFHRITCAAYQYTTGESEEAIEDLKKAPNNRDTQILLAELLALSPSKHGEVEEILRGLSTYTSRNLSLERDLGFGLPEGVYLLMKDVPGARKASLQRLKESTSISAHEKSMLRFIAEDIGEDELLREQSDSSIHLADAHRLIGMKYYADGYSKKALFHWQQCVESCRFWPQAYIARALQRHIVANLNDTTQVKELPNGQPTAR